MFEVILPFCLQKSCNELHVSAAVFLNFTGNLKFDTQLKLDDEQSNLRLLKLLLGTTQT